MYSAEDQKLEIRKIQRAVNASLKARRFLKKGGSPPEANILDLEASPIDADSLPTPAIPPLQQNILYPFKFHPDAPLAETSDELSMIMNYLDNIFPLQFYFYQPSGTERGRGWLLSMLLRSKALYYAALAFSHVQQVVFVHNENVKMAKKLLVDLDRYHSLALAELQLQLEHLSEVTGPDHLKLGLEILACTMQLSSIEVWRETTKFPGWRGDWEVHLIAAGKLLSVIGSSLEQSSEGPSNIVLALDELAGFDFFTTVFVWADVLRGACLGPTTSVAYEFPYLSYLEEDRINLVRVMGCENWAMASIRKISDFHSWKASVNEGNVSLLYRKAAEIETCLDNGLGKLQKETIPTTTYERESHLITETYALAAQLYLAVVISDNSHTTPQVMLGVSKALAALKALPQHLLIRVSWPFSITGCMCDASEKVEFRNMLSTADSNGHPLGTLCNGLEIMESCWDMREKLNHEQLRNSKIFPWTMAMENLDDKILLI